MQCLFLFGGQVIPYGWVWSRNPMDTSVHIAWPDNWRHKIEAIDWDGVVTMSLQVAWECKQKVFSVPLTSCTPHVPVIPSFPPSIFWCHSPSAHSFLCLSHCVSHLHVLHCKQPRSNIPVMPCMLNIPIVPSLPLGFFAVTHLTP